MPAVSTDTTTGKLHHYLPTATTAQGRVCLKLLGYPSALPPPSPMITQHRRRAHWMAVGCIPYSTSCVAQGAMILFQEVPAAQGTHIWCAMQSSGP